MADRYPNGVPVDLLVIACEGRARLLEETLQSFLADGGLDWPRRILALDGTDPEALAVGKRYGFVRAPAPSHRRGLLLNMKAGYSLAQAPLVFHLEEDWRLVGTVPLRTMAAAMMASPRYGQVRLSNKEAILPDGNGHYSETGDNPEGRGMRLEPDGLYAGSASCAFGPHLAWRLDFLDYVRSIGPGSGADRTINVEYLHRVWHFRRGRISAVVDPAIGRVEHIGGGPLGTDRKWHNLEVAA